MSNCRNQNNKTFDRRSNKNNDSRREIRPTRPNARKHYFDEGSDDELKINKDATQEFEHVKTENSNQPKNKTSLMHQSKLDLEKLIKLESITGLARSEAIKLLETSDDNLEKSVNLYFTNVSKKSESSSILSDASQSKRYNPLKRSLNDDNNEKIDKDIVDNEDNIRDPIPQKIEKLLDYDPYGPQIKRQRSAFDGFRSVKEELDGGITSSRHKTLASIFKPPIDLLFNGSFEASKVLGCDKNKWIMLNVQNQEIFDCSALNRDIWNDETIREIIKANFIFVQVYYDSVEGQKLMNYYQINAYPFVGIIDPRTGEKIYQFKNQNRKNSNCVQMDQQLFCEKLTNFLCDHESPIKDDDDANVYINSTLKKQSIITKNSLNNQDDFVQVIDDEDDSDVITCNDKKNKDIKDITRFNSDDLKKKNSNPYKSNANDEFELKYKLKKYACDKPNTCDYNNDSNHENELINHPQKGFFSQQDNNIEENCIISKENDNKELIYGKDSTIKKSDNINSLSKSVPKESKDQNMILKYETSDQIRDCVLRILLPNGQKLDFFTNGESKLKLLIDHLKTMGYTKLTHCLIERLMPLIKMPSNHDPSCGSQASTIEKTNQSRNIFQSDQGLTFKQLNLFPRTFLFLQEL